MTKISLLPADSAPAASDVLAGVQTSSDTTEKFSLANLESFLNDYFADNSGWINANETWTYASATTINVPSGAKYAVGMRVKFVQSSTTVYGVVFSISGNVLTLWMLNGATIANSAISGNFFSTEQCPMGMQSILTTSYTNTASAGGTMYYRINADGSKELWGQATSVVGSSTPSTYTINFPTSPFTFFNSIQTAQLTVGPNASTNNQDANIGGGSLLTTTSIGFEVWANTTTGTESVQAYIRGT